MQAGRATVRRKSALDECRVLLLALIAFTIPSPIMKPPKDLTYESSPSGVITSGSRRSGILRLIGPLASMQQANDSRSHPMSVK